MSALSPELKTRLLARLPELSGRPILIVGDVGLDYYTHGQVRRISPEAPVPILEVEREEHRLGLAANVAQNVASLGGQAVLLSVVGSDAAADSLRQLLRDAGVSPEHLTVDPSRPTTRKTRLMSGNHHLVRVDHEVRQMIQADVRKSILRQVAQHMPRVGAVVIQDYAKGVVSRELVQGVVDLARAADKRVLADPNPRTPLATYHGVDLMTPNHDESVALTGIDPDELRRNPDARQDFVELMGQRLMAGVGSSQMVITLGKDGMAIFEKSNSQSVRIPTQARQVFDVTGAGDTVIAALALAWSSGLSLQESCAFGNVAAGIVVGKVGCVPCPLAELREALTT
jgi:rfaE bifunctional protein kinase chain/domain